MKSNEEIITQLAVDFIKFLCNNNIDYDYKTILDYIQWSEALEYKGELTPLKLIKMIRNDFSTACWIVDEFAIGDNSRHYFLDGKLMEYIEDDIGYDVIQIKNKYLGIENEKIIEYKIKYVKIKKLVRFE